MDAIQAVVNIATNARKGTGKRKGFCAFISIDIRNAFNTARWNICIEAMMRRKVLDYLLRMIDDYLSDRWLIYEGDKWSLNEEMTCGASQGSRVGPLVWNVMYDDFLCMDLPAGTSIIGFEDDTLVVLGKHEVGWKTSIKYLGVQLDRRLSFGQHLKIAAAKAIQCGAILARLMPNIGEPREGKRRLVASVVHSELLYVASVLANALQNHAIQRKLFSAQRLVALRIV